MNSICLSYINSISTQYISPLHTKISIKRNVALTNNKQFNRKYLPFIFYSFFIGEITTYADDVTYKVKPSPYKNIYEITIYLLNCLEQNDYNSFIRFSIKNNIKIPKYISNYQITQILNNVVNVLIDNKPYQFKYLKHNDCWMLYDIISF